MSWVSHYWAKHGDQPVEHCAFDRFHWAEAHRSKTVPDQTMFDGPVQLDREIALELLNKWNRLGSGYAARASYWLDPIL